MADDRLVVRACIQSKFIPKFKFSEVNEKDATFKPLVVSRLRLHLHYCRELFIAEQKYYATSA